MKYPNKNGSIKIRSGLNYYIVTFERLPKFEKKRFETWLRSYGAKVVTGVYEVLLNEGQLKQTSAKATNIVQMGGTIKIYPLCHKCKSNAFRYGSNYLVDEGDYFVV